MALHLVNAVDRPNFGICLDSFHEITNFRASPFAISGKYPNADLALSGSLRDFKEKFPLEKIFYVQLSDGEKFDLPFSTQRLWCLAGEAPKFTWSKHARPFTLEAELGGYMPVVDVVKAWVLNKKFMGWVSLEVFNRRMRDEGFRVETAGIRARDSWRGIQEAMTIGTECNL
jgi:sugar phosphate isomerase/epimerase